MSKTLVTNFHDDLRLNILKNLKQDNPKAKESGACLNGLRCPACGKPEAFTYLDKPFALICHRNNQCGMNTPIKGVYPELWQDLAKRYPPTPKDKKATARAYLESRKLDTVLFKFEQSSHSVNGKTYPTVKFTFAGIVQHRLIDYLGKDKNRTIGSYTGKVYEALIDVTEIKDSDLRVFVTEGIIDALSWRQSGHSAIATLSSGHCPHDYFEQHKDRHYVLSFDNDKAGHEAIAKHIALFGELGIDYSVFLPPVGRDANDLLVSDSLNDGTIQRGLWQGKLHTAKEPLEYFETYLEQHPTTRKLIFTFWGESFKVFIKTDKNGDDITPPVVVKLADCSIKLLYSIVNDSVELAQKIHHVLELESKREGINRVKISASETTNLNPFKEVLQNHRQQFYGNGQDLAGLFDMLYKNKPPKIRELSIIGYDAKSGCYVFPKFMYDKKGKRIELNKNGYFDNGIMPFANCSDSVIKRTDTLDLKAFIELVRLAYGNKGLMALGFYVSTLFSHIIFEYCGFFPFLSLCGDPHAGKSFLAKVLNRCFFIDAEGDTMTSANTQKAELRKISQKSSLVCSLLEGRKGKTRFDYDGILPLYNRNNLYSRATTSQDNQTHDLAFSGALSFVWNHELFELKPAKERVISLHFAENDLNEETSKAWNELNKLSPEQLAGLGHFILSNREHFEKTIIQQYQDCTNHLKANGITTTRIADNHAIALAGIYTLLNAIGTGSNSYGLLEYATERANRKLETAKTDSHLADYFFSCISDMDTGSGVLVDSDNNQLIVHLPSALKWLGETGQGFNDKAALIAELKHHERFVTFKTTRAFVGKVCDCYFFKT